MQKYYGIIEPMSADLKLNKIEFLRKNFPYQGFRGSQEKVIEASLEGHDVLALMPTGQGKSLCYQFLSRWHAQGDQGLTLVVSPLIALMQDQVTQARELGIQAAFLSSILSKDERIKKQKEISEGKYDLLFVTPERFRKTEFWDCLATRKIALMAVDEAHCISQWGHDFRPDYSRLGEIRKKLGQPRVLALTATATPQVQTEITELLNFEKGQIISDGLERSNLALNVHEVLGFDDKVARLFDSLESRKVESGSVLIYSALIQTVYSISQQLNRKKIPHLLYHGDLNPQQKKGNLKTFQREANSIMVATPAFGLGIDKANVRQVIHFEVPGSIESYFQEIGRAGRDGKPSETHLLFDEDDISIQMEFIKWSHPEDSFILKVYRLIEKNTAQIQQDGFDFLREQMSFKNRRDFRVEAAANILERLGCLERTSDPFPFQIVREPTKEDFALEKSQDQFKHQNTKLLELLRWAQNSEDCRLVGIYKYFGHEGKRCELCDNCQNQ